MSNVGRVRFGALGGGLVALLVLGSGGVGALSLVSGGDYTVTVVMPQAPNLVKGNKVEINGLDVGRVKRLAVRDGQAVVTVSVGEEYSPLHTGTKARIEWKALLGERVLILLPGPVSNPLIPSGGMVEGTNGRVELDQVLAALDAPTRTRLQSLVVRLEATLGGSEADVNATVAAAGPTIAALGAITASLGEDGKAISNIVTRLRELSDTTTARRQEIARTVSDLTRLTEATAAEQAPVRQALRQLPGTLTAAREALDQVPGTVDAATPLLQDARPLARRLGPVSRDLRPLLIDLRATVTDLRPALSDAAGLLGRTPALLDGTAALSPGLQSTVQGALPALKFLRPYTPELVGWLSNWGSAAANYDSIGNYARIWAQAGSSSANETPGVLAGGITSASLKDRRHRVPGELADQPWTDANGSDLR